MQTELTLQEKLKDLRMERKLTLEQLANRQNCPVQRLETMNRMKSGTSALSH